MVAAATIDISSASIDSVSIKTSSTDQKSVVKFDDSTETLEDVRIEMDGAGGDIDIETTVVTSLEVKASGTESS